MTPPALPGDPSTTADSALSQALSQALALAEAGQPDAAARAFAAAQAAHPRDATLPVVAGHFFRRNRLRAEALAAARQAVALAPAHAAAHALLGLCLLDRGELDAAQAALRQALHLDAGVAGAHNALGVIANLELRHDDAEDHWATAIESGAEDTAPLINLAQMLRATGRGDEAAALLAPAVEVLPQDVALQWAAAVASNYAPQLAAQAVAEQHRRHGRAVRSRLPAEALRPLPRTQPRTQLRAPAGSPLRVGFLSPDFREHSVAWFLLPLLRHLDPSRVHVTAYMTSQRADAMTALFRAAVPLYTDCAALADLALVRRVREDKLDVLVDCAGLFDGARPGALALRMAPVQATWLGYPNTTGLPNMDVRLVDALTDPQGSETLATERLVRIAGPFLCWQPWLALPLPQRDPARPVVFGCFNHLAKVHDGLLQLWARLLAAVPGSRLLLKSPPLASADVASRLRQRCAELGIAPSRLELRGPLASRAEHLAAYGDIDIALDTYPYHGTTTTCEALWMGTPVVTLAGIGHPSRVGVSLLHSVGLHDWVADSADRYVAIAAGLAGDRPQLAALQRTLRPTLERSPLCDAAGFARRYADVLEGL